MSVTVDMSAAVGLSERARAAVGEVHAVLNDMGAPDAANTAVAAILDKIDTLAAFPEMGQMREHIGPGYREMGVPFGAAGYAVLYRYSLGDTKAVILNIWHYREAGYRP